MLGNPRVRRTLYERACMHAGVSRSASHSSSLKASPVSPFAIYGVMFRDLRRRRSHISRVALNGFVILTLLLSSFSIVPSSAEAHVSGETRAVNSSGASAPQSSFLAPNSSATIQSTPQATVTPGGSGTATSQSTPQATVTPGGSGTATSQSTPQATVTPGGSGTATSTPIGNTPPPTYTISAPTPAPTVELPPDTSYVDEAIEEERAALQAQVDALSILTGTITGTLVTGATGGRIESLDGGLTLGLLPGVVPVTDTINVQMNQVTYPSGDPRAYRNGHPLHYTYELTATRLLDGQRVEQFSKEAVLVWDMDVAAAAGVVGFPVNVYRYDEARQSWEEVLTRWDEQTNQLIATTPHFSIYAVDPAYDPVKNYVPSVSNFEVDLQSGTASIQYPISLPPGPAGFGPKVSLSYNSGNIDRVDVKQQGTSSIGWGWSLSSSYIAATQHHFGASCSGFAAPGYHPWTASIVVDGINGDLVKTQDPTNGDGHWRTSNDSFARIEYIPGVNDPPTSTVRTSDSWVAWGKDGTKYEFGPDSNAIVGDPCAAVGGTRTTYKWMLSQATDVHGNIINYTYKWQRGDNNDTLVDDPPTGTDKARAVYPSKITYGGTITETTPMLQVTFDVVTRTISGLRDVSQADIGSDVYQAYRINKIKVQRRQQDTNDFALLRSYALTQTNSITLTVPSIVSIPVVYPHLTLEGITAFGSDDQTRLPATTFRYVQNGDCPDCGFNRYDHGHLWWAFNGYGGQVGFYYTAAGGDVSQAYRRVRAKRTVDGMSGDDPPPDPGQSNPHDFKYFYEYRGADVNGTNTSYAANEIAPLDQPYRQFRGYAWVRQIDPLQQPVDHYFEQTDDLKAKEWRSQGGKAKTFSDGLDTTPTATVNPNWTVSGDVYRTTDPDATSNGVWALRATGASILRQAGVQDGSDVSVRMRVRGTEKKEMGFEGKWVLVNANGNGEYFGLEIYPWMPPNENVYQLQKRLIWGKLVNGTIDHGSRNLSHKDLVTYLPYTHEGLKPDNWYRLQLHTSPDGRVALELYRDGLLQPDYIQVKSSDLAETNGPVPSFDRGTTWKFKHEVTRNDETEFLSLVDDYSETRTVYGQSDTVYEGNKTHSFNQAAAFITAVAIGVGNNCRGMVIRFVPPVESSSTKYGEASQVGQMKRTRSTFAYDTQYGNQSEVKSYGDVDASGDERSTTTTYAIADRPEYDQYIVAGPKQTLGYQGITTTVLLAETQYSYDYRPSYDDEIPIPSEGGKGRLTRVKQVGVENGSRNGQSSSQQFRYDDRGNKDQVTDPRGNNTTTFFDAYYHSFPMTTTYPMGTNAPSAYTFYDFTKDTVSSTVDVNTTESQFESDVFGRPSKSWVVGEGTTTNPGVTYSFPDTGLASISAPYFIHYRQRLDASTNQYGWHTRWFDGIGRTVQDIEPKPSDTNASQVIVVSSAYTVTGVLSTTTMPYLATASPTQYVQPDFTKPKTTQFYDGAGRPSMMVNPDNSQVIYDYTQLLWTGVKDESDHQKWQRTDMLGRTDFVWEQNCPTCEAIKPDLKVSYGYDLLDRLTSVTRDPENLTPAITTLEYDGLGRKSSMSDPDMGTWNYKYDDAGNLTEQQDALYLENPTVNASHRLFFTYDTMNRIKAKYYGTAHYQPTASPTAIYIPDVKYYYDDDLNDADTKNSWGKLRYVEVTLQGQGQEKANGHGYEYDFKGRPVADVITTTNYYNTSSEYVVSYTYDVGNRMRSVTYPDPEATPETVSITYNNQSMGLPNKLTSSVQNNPYPVYSVEYNERGQIDTMLQGSPPTNNGLTTAYVYNTRGWLTNTLVTAPNGSGGTNTHLNLGMTFEANGNISEVSNQNITNPGTNNPTFTNTFTYDELDRLKTASSSSSQITSIFDSEEYNFDTLGRMTTRIIASTQQTYGYTDPDHVDAPTSYKTNSYDYDANGNQISRTQNNIIQTRTFDPENRMVGLNEERADASQTTDDYVYDGNGKRLIKVSNERGPGGSPLVTTRTLYIGNMYEEEIPNGQNARPYINYYMLGAKMVGMRRANQQGNSDGQFRIVGDHLGSTSLVVDTSTPPQVVHRQYYKPYGEVARTYGSTRTTIGFTGQRLDGESGLMYYGARYYDPVLSFFILADPTVPDAGNAKDYHKYLYVRANPLRYTDSLGYGPDDYYVFVYGCTNPSEPGECDQPHGFGDYTKKYLASQYAIWQAQYRRLYGEDVLPSWEEWSAEHIRTVAASNEYQGAALLKDELAKIKKQGDIHILGHSMGGGAVLLYLIYGSQNSNVDPRIKSVALIDSNLNDAWSIAEAKGLTGAELMQSLSEQTRMKSGSVLQVNVEGSFVHSTCIEGLADCRVAKYSRTHEDPRLKTPSSSADDFMDPVRQAWHNYSYRTFYGTNYQDWFYMFWR